jgi:hypothetical protein
MNYLNDRINLFYPNRVPTIVLFAGIIGRYLVT